MPKRIPLTRGQTALVDESDFAHLSQWKWLYIGSGYAGRFRRESGAKRLIYLHRHIMDAQPGQRVDHINGNRLDCRRENLRLVTLNQNQQNRKKPARSSSGYKGVCWHRGIKKWHVRIGVNGARLHLGYYTDAETAALLYDAAARHFFGEYAKPNFPDRATSYATRHLLVQRLAVLAQAGRLPSDPPACKGRCVLCRNQR